MEEIEVKRGPGRPPKSLTEPAPRMQQEGDTEALQARIRSMELQLRSLTGKRESLEEVVQKAGDIVAEVRKASRGNGANRWRVHNSRYRDAAGDPVTHEFWSDASDPEMARADYNRRNGRYWSPDEGDDPLKFELIVEQ